MKQIIQTLMFICAVVFQSKAQVNYVLNPSFEQYNSCPATLDEIQFANHWTGIDTITWLPGDPIIPSAFPYCLPEFCNVCSSNTECCSVPYNKRFFQYPRSGNGMAQEVMYFDESYSVENRRDYLQGKLISHLNPGESYCVTFYVNFEGNVAFLPSGYAVDHIGAYLDDGSIDLDTGSHCGQPHPSISPQVFTTSIISDTINWTKIQGSFTASGSEKFITIGNFFDKVHTNTISYSTAISMGGNFSVYLVDDVSVIKSNAEADAGTDQIVSPGSDSVFIGILDEGMPVTWYLLGSSTPIGYKGGFKVHPDTTTSYVVEMDLCGNVSRDTVTVYVAPAGVVQMNRYKDAQIYPNPVITSITIVNAKGSDVYMYDVMGRQVFNTTIYSNKDVQNIQQLAPGMYILQVVDPATGFKITKKIVKE